MYGWTLTVTKDKEFQVAVDALEKSIKNVFNNGHSHGDTNNYDAVEDELMTVYYQALAIESLPDMDKEKVMLLVFDLAENISPNVSRHLIELDDDFARGK